MPIKLIIGRTDEIVELIPGGAEFLAMGVPVRVWRGITDSGTPIRALVALVAVERTEDQAAFERELIEKFPTAEEPRVFPARMVL